MSFPSRLLRILGKFILQALGDFLLQLCMILAYFISFEVSLFDYKTLVSWLSLFVSVFFLLRSGWVMKYRGILLFLSLIIFQFWRTLLEPLSISIFDKAYSILATIFFIYLYGFRQGLLAHAIAALVKTLLAYNSGVLLLGIRSLN